MQIIVEFCIDYDNGKNNIMIVSKIVQYTLIIYEQVVILLK